LMVTTGDGIVTRQEWVYRGATAMKKEGLYSMTEAAKLSGVPAYTLQNWHTRGFMQPTLNLGSGRGMGKKFSLRDLIGLRAVRALRDSGVSLQRVRKLAEALREIKGRTRTLDALAASRLVVLPDNTVAVLDNMELLDVITRQGIMGSFVSLDLGPVVQEMQAKVDKFEAARKAA
jgi:DNA-binding transcriptional MerR regulator